MANWRQVRPAFALVLLGDVDHQSAGIQTGIGQQRGQIQRPVGRVQQGHGADVQEQPARQVQCRKAAHHLAAGAVFDLDAQMARTRRLEQAVRRPERTALRAPDESFVPQQRPFPHPQDGLEDGAQIPMKQQSGHIVRSPGTVMIDHRRLAQLGIQDKRHERHSGSNCNTAYLK